MKRLSKNSYSVVPALFCIKTEKLNPYGESLPGYLCKRKQFFSFQCFAAPEMFRSSSGTFP